MKDNLENIIPPSLKLLLSSPALKMAKEIRENRDRVFGQNKFITELKMSGTLNDTEALSSVLPKLLMAGHSSNSLLPILPGLQAGAWRNVEVLPSIASAGMTFKALTKTDIFLHQHILPKFLTDNFALMLPRLSSVNNDILIKINEFTTNVLTQELKVTSSDISEFSKVLDIADSKAKNDGSFWDILISDASKEKASRFLLALIFGLTINYLYDLAKSHISLPFLSAPTATNKKMVITKAKTDICEEQLSACRFVTVGKLDIFAAAGKKHQIIDSLNFGQGVIINVSEVNKADRDWVFINYYDNESNSYQRGWVYRRYLKRYIN